MNFIHSEKVHKYMRNAVLLFLPVLLFIIMLLQTGHSMQQRYRLLLTVDAEDTLQVSYREMKVSQNTIKYDVKWQEVDGQYYLFLPSSAKTDSVNVYLDDEKIEERQVMLDDHLVTADGLSCVLGEGTHSLIVDGKKYDFQIIKSENLPAMYLELDADLEQVQADRTFTAAGFINTVSKSGTPEYEGQIEQMHGHGNSSWNYAKKSYQIKLTSDGSLLGLDAGKKWLLIGNAMDQTMIRNKLFLDLAQSIGLQNAIGSAWVDLYVNHIYQGCYLLTEKIDISSDRLDINNLEKQTKALNEQDITTYPNYHVEENGMTVQGWMIPNNPADITGGYLLELDYPIRYDAEPSKFITRNQQHVVIKNPKYTTVEQTNYISSFVQEFEDAVYAEDGINPVTGKSYLDYIDMESFVKRYMIDEISKNIDAGYSSWFFYKPIQSDRLYAGPVWDYDTALGNAGGWGDSEMLENPEGMYADSVGWTQALCQKEDFQNLVTYYYHGILGYSMRDLLDTKIENYMDTLDGAVEMDGVLYGYTYGEWQQKTAKMQDYLRKRIAYLDKMWQ